MHNSTGSCLPREVDSGSATRESNRGWDFLSRTPFPERSRPLRDSCHASAATPVPQPVCSGFSCALRIASMRLPYRCIPVHPFLFFSIFAIFDGIFVAKKRRKISSWVLAQKMHEASPASISGLSCVEVGVEPLRLRFRKTSPHPKDIHSACVDPPEEKFLRLRSGPSLMTRDPLQEVPRSIMSTIESCSFKSCSSSASIIHEDSRSWMVFIVVFERLEKGWVIRLTVPGIRDCLSFSFSFDRPCLTAASKPNKSTFDDSRLRAVLS